MEANVGEFRRLHIIYFLSRMGRIEQPHLFRVTHLNKNGVFLRDVKRWLSDLRGKDMPDSFSWSYKRRYGKGFVWQDLADDDLITPISDHEFVLKGSQIVPSLVQCLCNQNKGLDPQTETQKSDEETALFGSERSSATTDECTENDHEEEKQSEEHDHINTTPSSTSCAYSKVGGRAHRFRNLLTCGAADTDDSVLVMRTNNNQPDGLIRKGQNLGGSARVFGSCWNQQNPRRSHDGTKKQRQTQTGEHKKPVCAAAYRPVRGPTCSQCGKIFKPEKLLKHMTSCRGVASQKQKPATTNGTESAYSHYLTK